jgi:hypothetical protein
MRIVKVTVLAVLICAVLATAVSAWWSYRYPFGRRPCTLQCMFGGLRQYASEHDGWFPKSVKSPYEALQQLYPTNCSAVELAGVTGNIGSVEAALRQGKPLNESLTSWAYMQGFRDDDPPNVAILWESRSGFYADGRRNSVGARPVVFLGGDFTNIPAADWTHFLDAQRRLRDAVLAKHIAPTNALSTAPH